jgi:hypothetical protein
VLATTTVRRNLHLSLITLILLVAVDPLTTAQTIRVDMTASHSTNSFVPTEALGAGIDRMNAKTVEKVFTPETISKVLTAGWQTVTYRQNTELFAEAWHWNPEGTWSDPAGQGYFTGNATPWEMIRHSYGYLLPHRGATRNDETGNNGYSRITDGDLATYWKSNPYLTEAFTGENDSLHPQWVTVDLANSLPVSAITIAWGEPYATKYLVQYWTGEDPIKQPTRGSWVSFPGGVVTSGHGGAVTLQLAPSPMPVHFLRIWMTESSNSCDSHGSADKRNCVGYAIRELFLGTAAASGEFYDLVRHTPEQDQTATISSSIDPWHAPSDLGPTTREQIGLDFFYTSGYTRGLPAMIPIALIYAIPEDAAAQITYLEKRGYPISYIEMGEEPDGQYMLPEDYAALYLQFATALHRVDPKLKLGGPVFQGVNEDIQVWPDAHGKTSWLGRFLDYLRAHGRLNDLAFMSFEHYPYEPCKVQWSSLYDEPSLISHIMQVWRDDGLSPNVPMLITELNIAWNSGESFVNTFGGLWLADFVGEFFTSGGAGIYYFHYPPGGVHPGCNESFGTFGMFTVDTNFQIQKPTSQFFASQLITQEWAQPGNGVHRVFRAASDVVDPASHVLVTAYAVLRPDGQWSLMVVNKDQQNSHKAHIVFNDSSTGDRFLTGPTDFVTFGNAQYQWHAQGRDGYPDPAGPAARSTVAARADTAFEFPAASVTVVRGKLGDNRARGTKSH